MISTNSKPKPADIFVDIRAHIESGRFIRANSLNRRDIRDFTFSPVDLKSCRNILDLGCAYGFFVRGLAGKLHPEAHINGVDLWEGCEKPYIQACLESGYSGEFCLSDKAFCKKYPDDFFDLVLCSYALYFFPEAIPEISRIIQPDGYFITVTHTVPHMQELIAIIKSLLKKHTGDSPYLLPMERLLASFSSANGYQLLSPWFREVTVQQYKNSLRINTSSLQGLIKYLCFKKPLFFPDDPVINSGFIETVVADFFRELIEENDSITISKNDTVYVCQYPRENSRAKQ